MGHRIRTVRVHEVICRVNFDNVTGQGDSVGQSILQNGIRWWVQISVLQLCDFSCVSDGSWL